METRLLLLSNGSDLIGTNPTGFARGQVRDFLGDRTRTVLFIPFASVMKPYNEFAGRVRKVFSPMGYELTSIHDATDPRQAVEKADAIAVGGGNTFHLLRGLYEARVVETIRARVRGGMPYVGWSAGSNVACPTIKTTNDMPIVYPPSFDALALVPFNINPHYKEADPLMAAGSETREDRIREYHVVNRNPVVGLEEGALVRVESGRATALGTARIKLFRRGAAPVWFAPGDRLPVR